MGLRKARRFSRAGFSLLELVVVVAVLAILAAIAIPAFQDAASNAKIATAKTNLNTVVKECLVLQASGKVNPTISDVASARSTNPYGDRLGLGFGRDDGFTYDTDLNSQRPLSPSDSCFALAAKSATFANEGGPAEGKLPHFSIAVDRVTGAVRKDCRVDSSLTYNKSKACDTGAPPGAQW